MKEWREKEGGRIFDLEGRRRFDYPKTKMTKEGNKDVKPKGVA